MKLNELRQRYLKPTYIEHGAFGRNEDKPFEYIDDSELIRKFNSNSFKLHPTLPIIVKFDGSEIYDIRDGFKCIVCIGSCTQKKTKNKSFWIW